MLLQPSHAVRAIWLVMAVVSSLNVQLEAGEKIIFSSPGTDGPQRLLDPREKQQFKPTGGLDNFRPTPTDPAQIPFVPASVSTTGSKKKNGAGGRNDESANDRREWIFNNIKEVEGRGDKKSSRKNSDEQERDSTEGKDKTAMEEFFESRTEAQKNSGKDTKTAKDAELDPTRDPDAPRGLDSETAETRPAGLRNNDGPGAVGRARTGGGLSRTGDEGGKLSGGETSELREALTGNRTTGTRNERLMERAARAEEFNRLLQPGAAGAAGGGASPFNFSDGNAFQSANPLSPSSFDALLGRRPAAGISGTLPGAAGGGSKPVLLDDLQSKPAGAISAPPVIFTPQTEILPPPRPSGILEVPKRKQ